MELTLSKSVPPTRLKLVEKSLDTDDNNEKGGNNYSKKNNTITPLSPQTRDDLISLVSYAMRIIASKVNVTLANYNKPTKTDNKQQNQTYIIEPRKNIPPVENLTKNEKTNNVGTTSSPNRQQENPPAPKVVSA